LWIAGTVAIVLVVLAAALPATAEEVEKKFRIGVQVGGHNFTDSIRSDSANQLTLFNRDESLNSIFRDPRNEQAALGEFGIDAGLVGTLTGQYAVTRFFVLEASVGYQRSDVGEIEVQGWLDIDAVRPINQNFNFKIFQVQTGELERVPLQLTGLVRFRPKARFNPYFGAGIGYSFIGFAPSKEFDQLSFNMDDSLGNQMSLSENTFGTAGLTDIGPTEDLEGAVVSFPDTFEWHIVGGAEFSFNRKWALIFDLRWIHASQSMSIGFNGGDDLGVAVPEFTTYIDSPLATEVYGAINVTQGGLVDGGSLVPPPTMPGIDCSVDPTDCIYSEEPDGERDTGRYYTQGGSVDYGGISLQIGFRYTF